MGRRLSVLLGISRDSAALPSLRCVPIEPLELMEDLPDLNIPDAYLTVIPSSDIHTPANQFRLYVFPPWLSSPEFPSDDVSLSAAPPQVTCNPDGLSKAPIPPASYLRPLKARLVNLTPDDRPFLRLVTIMSLEEVIVLEEVITRFHPQNLFGSLPKN